LSRILSAPPDYDLSYYGFIIYDIGDDFTEIVKEAIKKNLLAQYASQEQVDEYLDNEIMFSKTNNRKVIGKMNTLVKYAMHSLACGEEDIEYLNLKLGQYGIIESEYVGDYIVQELNKRMPDKIFDRSIVDAQAQKAWDALPEETRQHFLDELFCFKCSNSDAEFIKILDDKIKYRLVGKCKQCGNEVVTLINKEKLENRNKSALDKWNAIPENIKEMLINNVFCGACGVTTIIDFDIKNDELGIVLEGKCKKCGNEVARFIEN
jgi:Fe-S cluster biogenesis protein NfuA